MLGAKDIISIYPEIIVAAMGCILLVADLLVPRDKKCAIAGFSVLTVAAAAVATLYLASTDLMGTVAFTGMFAVDGYSTFFKFVFYIATILCMMISFHYVREEGIDLGEYYVLMLFSLAGMMVMASAADLLSAYIGIELMSLPTYALVAFSSRSDERSSEGAMKYVVLGALSSGVLLYGISLVYGLTGTTELSAVAASLSGAPAPALAVAVVMLVVGFAFKVAGVPFHMWAPDAYEGAPTPITAFMSVAAKAAAFALLLRVFLVGLVPAFDQWQVVVGFVAVASMFYGNLVAISQTNMKRMLAYSSIGHAGYALLGLLPGTAEGVSSVMYYMLVYAFMNIGIFGVIVMLRKGAQRGEDIREYTGLAKTNRGLALVMLVFLFSLAGIPPMAGFVGKFYIFMALIHEGMVGMAVVAVVMSAVAAYFYIRVVMVMYMREPEAEVEVARSRGTGYAVAIAVFGTVVLGVYPGHFIRLVELASTLL